jgi:hypothetical protein
MPHDMITGTIAAVRDCGSLVLVFLDADNGRIIPVPIERRAFGRLLEGKGCGPGEIIGRSATCVGELLAFLD